MLALILCVTILPINPIETSNSIAASRLADVAFSSEGGAYIGPVTIELSHENANAAIYYTLDGSEPTKSSALYTAPIAISSSSTLKAIAIAEGYYSSYVKSETYNILTTFEFKETTLSLEEFQTQDLKTILSVGEGTCDGITWSSSTPEIAEVDSKGILTAKKQGGTVITASSKNGTTTQCTVIITAPTISIPTSKKLNVGSSVSLYSSSKKLADKITWKTSNSSIATVDSDGTVAARNSGTCKISAICGSATKTCKITVATVKIKISKSSLKVTFGKSKKLKASGNLPSSWIQWKSSNSKVASVNSSGNVTAKSQGTCVISAYYGKKKANCKVTVPSYKLKGPKTLTLYSGESRSVKKGLTINGIKMTSVSAKAANKKIVSIKSGYMYGKKAGTTKVTFTAKGKKLVCKVKVPRAKITTPKKITLNYQYGNYIYPTIKTKRGNVYITKATSSNSKKVQVSYYGNSYVRVYANKYNCSTKIKIYFSDGTIKKVTVKVPNLTLDEKIEKQSIHAETSSIYTDSYGSRYHYAYIYNNSSKHISYVKYAVLEYDNKGDRLSYNKTGYIHEYNDYIWGGYSGTQQNYLYSDARKVRVCVKKVWFEDGKTWTNPLYNKWYKKYKKKYGK